jgi:hypothetical protein
LASAGLFASRRPFRIEEIAHGFRDKEINQDFARGGDGRRDALTRARVPPNKPKIPHQAVLSVLRSYGLQSAEATFLPSGDSTSAVYRVTGGGLSRNVRLNIGCALRASIYRKGGYSDAGRS